MVKQLNPYYFEGGTPRGSTVMPLTLIFVNGIPDLKLWSFHKKSMGSTGSGSTCFFPQDLIFWPVVFSQLFQGGTESLGGNSSSPHVQTVQTSIGNFSEIQNQVEWKWNQTYRH